MRVSCQHIVITPKYFSISILQRLSPLSPGLPFVERVCMQIRFSYHASSVSFKLELFLSLSLTFLTNKFLNVAGQLFYRMCFHLVLSDVFMIRFVLRIFSRTIPKGLLCSFNSLEWSLFDLSWVMSHTLIPWLSFCLLSLSSIALFSFRS